MYKIAASIDFQFLEDIRLVSEFYVIAKFEMFITHEKYFIHKL
jgi:hypothetical protein